ncbi:probable glutamate receptor [Panulirus ornatus]|uniref:probable glutamate receptor n=1 Tax=Panulirus ornatus TaxID=150431 RepID=UPI003A8B7A69
MFNPKIKALAVLDQCKTDHTLYRGYCTHNPSEKLQEDLMIRPVQEVLEDPKVAHALQQQPATFRFEDGASLVVSVVAWPPHHDVLVQGDGSLSVVGPVGNVLDTVAQSLNFTYRLVTPADQHWGRKLANGSWTGMVGQVARREVDIALGPFGLTEERSKVVDYTRSFFFDDRSILSAKGLPEIDPWGFLFPLAPMVWTTLLAAMMAAWFAVVVLVRHPRGSRMIKWASDLFFLHLGIVLRQDMSMKLKCVKERCVVGGWLVVAMMVTWSYNGNLISLLAVRHIPQPIQTIKDLVDDTRISAVMLSNSIFSDIISKMEIGDLKELNDLKFAGRAKFVIFAEFTEAMDTLVRRGDHSIIDTSLSTDDFIAQDFARIRRCDFYKSRQTFFTTHHCMIGQKGSPIVPAISYRIRSLVEAGLYEHWLRNNIPFSSHCRFTPSKLTVREPLAVSNLWGMLVLLGAGHLLALTAACCELWVGRRVDTPKTPTLPHLTH